jgi:hypothetical protein
MEKIKAFDEKENPENDLPSDSGVKYSWLGPEIS